MASSDPRAHQIASMLETKGWQIVEEWIRGRIERIKDEILHTPPDATLDIIRFQAEAAVYKSLLGHVNGWMRKLHG